MGAEAPPRTSLLPGPTSALPHGGTKLPECEFEMSINLIQATRNVEGIAGPQKGRAGLLGF